MDKNLIITKEHLPSRCEICHQSDMFVATTGECGRCKDTVIKSISSKASRKRHLNIKQQVASTLVLATYPLIIFCIIDPLFKFVTQTWPSLSITVIALIVKIVIVLLLPFLLFHICTRIDKKLA